MKKIKFKSWIVPSIYVFSIGIIIASLMFIGKFLAPDELASSVSKYVPNNVVSNDDASVVEVVKPTNETVNHPYLMESVKIAKKFYDKEASEEEQIKSLIFYKNTYMGNTGVLYENDKEFDVVSVLDGTITSITKDDILGNVVEVMHTNELITVYECLGEVNVRVGDHIKQNDVIGKSGKVNVDNGYENALLFEVNYKGAIINPEQFYNMKISELLNQ